MKTETDFSRRAVLETAAAAGTAALASSCVTNSTSPEHPDLASLNALLAAEYKAIDAYTTGAAVLQADPSPLGQLVLAVAREFQKDHREHARVLAQTVAALGGIPFPEGGNKFTLPEGFRASTPNVMKLACNEERRAAVAYNQVIKGLTDKTNRFIAAAIQGDETMHFMALVALIEGLAVPTSELTATRNADQVVPVAFASSTSEQGGGPGLQSEPDFETGDLL